MRSPHPLLLLCLLLFLAIGFCCSPASGAADDVPYGIANARWPEVLGNHRARVQVDQKADAVWAQIPWRRRDPEPEKKNVVVVDAATGRPVKNRGVARIDRIVGDVIFQPVTAPGEYHVYYLPFTEDKVHHRYRTQYAPPEATAEEAWLARNGLTPDGLRAGRWQTLPEAKVLEFQTSSPFHRFDPMEVIASPGAALAQCSIFTGSDKGATWGPGLALLWRDKVVRINLRAEGRFGVDDGPHFTFAGFVAPESWYHLRVRVEPKEVLAEASSDGKLWYPLQTFPRSQFPGDPVAVRLGKTGPGARNEDYSLPGPVGTCRIKDLEVFGRREQP